jgi:hypothetical protein
MELIKSGEYTKRHEVWFGDIYYKVHDKRVTGGGYNLSASSPGAATEEGAITNTKKKINEIIASHKSVSINAVSIIHDTILGAEFKVS